MALTLIDKSAWVRRDASFRQYGDLCTCAMSRMEILFSARGLVEYARVSKELSLFHDLRMNAETFAAAEAAQGELARTGEHRVALPDVLIGACAQQHGADLLHRDKHFDLLAGIFGFRSIRV